MTAPEQGPPDFQVYTAMHPSEILPFDHIIPTLDQPSFQVDEIYRSSMFYIVYHKRKQQLPERQYRGNLMVLSSLKTYVVVRDNRRDTRQYRD